MSKIGAFQIVILVNFIEINSVVSAIRAPVLIFNQKFVPAEITRHHSYYNLVQFSYFVFKFLTYHWNFEPCYFFVEYKPTLWLVHSLYLTSMLTWCNR